MVKSLPGKVTRTTSRAGLGGGALLIALALFLLFRGFGPGGTGASGSGTPGDGKSSTLITTASSSDSTSMPSGKTADDEVRGGLTTDEKKALGGETLTVLIDEHDFLMGVPGTPDMIYRPTPLSRLAELARLSKGDTNGIRVQILRRETSRASAEEELKLELSRQGIHSDAIVMPGDFVP